MKTSQKILKLKPTQYALGILEVHHKIKEMSQWKPRRIKKMVKENPIPVVVSPAGELYLVDHHHFLFVCWHLGIKKVEIKVVKDFSNRKMSFTQFWQFMTKSGFYYAFCQFGEGPRAPVYLPQDIRGLADDPYRSLAWFVRHQGAYDNSDIPFSEFKWANLFRRKRLLHRHGRADFENAVKKAIKIAISKEARRLPGYRGKLSA